MNYQSLFAPLEKPRKVVVPAATVKLRPYQVDAVDAVYREWESGHRSTLVCLPTGCGKSVVFSEVMRRYNGGRILVIAHREELIYQAVAHARTAGLSVGIEMGCERAHRQDVIVSSVQTQTAVSKCRQCFGEGCQLCHGKGKVRRMTRFDPRSFGLVIVDEGHHATAKSYRMVTHWYMQNPDCRVLLVTATPERADGVGLWNVADSCAYRMDLQAAIGEGWLCPIRQRFVTVDSLDLSQVGTKAGGDLADGELEKAFLGDDAQEEQRLLHSIAKPTVDQANGRPTLVFASGCEHAQKLTGAFNAYPGVTAEMVLGTTDKDERKRIVERYKRHETQVLVGVGCFTEGFDAPATEVVAVARPTKSASLYLQMIGRVTRPLPGVVDGPATAEERRAAISASQKPTCVVLDFVGNSGRHKLISVADVLAGASVDAADLAAAIVDAKRADAPVDMEALIAAAKQRREKREAEQRARYTASSHRAESARYVAEDVDLFGGRDFRFLEHYTPGPDGATEAQVRTLVRLGIHPKTAMGYSKRQASVVISEKTKGGHGADFIMPFGKHAGKKLRDLPSEYVDWMADNIDRPHIQREIRAFRNRLQVASDRSVEEAPF